ncbi:MAG: hypothetical protein N3A55_01480 [Methylohalobius sp.]|nr:hypothetical protein [Methylohalobius sp.]
MAKVFQLHQGRLIKQYDVTNSRHALEIQERCQLLFDFARIWP